MVADTLAISLTLRWRPCGSGGAPDARRIACRLEAEPCIPAPVLSALQEMLGERIGRYRQLDLMLVIPGQNQPKES